MSQKCVKEIEETKNTKTIEDNIIKNTRNLFSLKTENEAIKDRIIRDIKNLQNKKKDYYKPVIYSYNYIDYESNGNRNKTKSVKEQLDEIKLYLKYVTNNLIN